MLTKRKRSFRLELKGRDGHRTGVNTTLALGGRNTLPTMTAGFKQKRFNERGLALDLEFESTLFVGRDDRAELVALRVLEIDRSLIGDQELRVLAALTGADF